MAQYTIEELVSVISDDITIFGALPKTLPDNSIRQFVETRALPWFYINYINATSLMYYYIDQAAFEQEAFTKYSYIEMPCEVQSISWIHQVRGISLMQLGLNSPNLSVNLGVTNQPYLSSYVTTIGELGVYKTLIDNMSDMLDQLTLYTTKYHYNQPSHRLNILTKLNTSLIAECHINIPAENMFTDPYFLKYCTAWAKMQQGRLMGQYDYTLQGGVKINHADMISQGKEEMKEVEDDIKGMMNNSIMVMVRK